MQSNELDSLEAMIAAEIPLDAAIPAAERSSPSDSANRFWFDMGLVIGVAITLLWLALR